MVHNKRADNVRKICFHKTCFLSQTNANMVYVSCLWVSQPFQYRDVGSDELGRRWKDAVMAGIFLQELRKTMTNLSITGVPAKSFN
jgi:hypothetical protein